MLYLWDVNDERQVLKFRWFIIGISDKHSHGLNNLKVIKESKFSKKNNYKNLFRRLYFKATTFFREEYCN